ncbi:amidohydrolase family protein [Wenzhouxiangella sp. AB-CW3]|uniref:amidohydrolase family protein n=1 Tax=Wenzhouxiangella sp. AB-CW3 TaxID=2771012 RepID=UPI00168B7080|nr:amidohydrolase family protein [Wenzhouxiangella sp. AB-CW3]QOC21848.1 amidohydrolase family protein [Wenzhouxiangella sp. AB-CW3]
MRYLIAIVVLSLSLSLDARTVVFENARLVDVSTAETSEPAQVGIRDGFIVEADAISEPDVVVSKPGYLIPGLAEMHAHVPPADQGQWVDDTLALYLAFGVTTIRGMLGEPGHLEIKRELASGERIGPRLITSGPSLNGNSVTSPEKGAVMVREQSEAGYDFLKLHPGLWPEAFDAIVKAARALDIDFAGHVSDDVGIERALSAGQITIDHLDAYMQALVPEDHELHGTEPGFFGINLAAAADPGRIAALVEKTIENNVWNVPTETLMVNLTGERSVEEMLDRPAMAYVPKSMREQWGERVAGVRENVPEEQRRAFLDIRRQLLAELHEAGAGILLGADAPQIMNVPGHAVHEELALYVAAGLSPAEALATGTVNVAMFFGQSGHGCLEPGCVADLVLLEANPLEDIGHTETIRGVMRAGEWFDRERLDSMLEAIAERAGNSE